MEWSSFRRARVEARRDRALVPGVSSLERRELMSGVFCRQGTSSARAAASRQAITSGALIAPGVHGYDPTNPDNPLAPPLPDQVLTEQDVSALLQRAAAAAGVNNAIIAVVDRNGTILGVRVESGVSTEITNNTVNKVFAIDGAVSLARTGAYFGNDQAPLTSRTIQEISQTTVTQREVKSNPDVPSDNGNSTLYGPGFVAPVGIKGHFPPGIMFTPQVDLYDIESTNRDSISPITGTRFNVPGAIRSGRWQPGCAGVLRTGHRNLTHGTGAGESGRCPAACRFTSSSRRFICRSGRDRSILSGNDRICHRREFTAQHAAGH